MTALFSKPKMPALPPPPPPPPSIDDAYNREEFTRKANRRKGRKAAVFSSRSATANPSVAAKTLLG